MGMLATSSGDFVSWDDVGDSVVGTITEFSIVEGGKFDSGPALAVAVESDDGETLVVPLRIRDLKEKLRDVFGDPDALSDLDGFIGDRLALTFSAREKLPTGNVAKLFDVEHKSSGEAAAAKPKSLL